MKPSLAKKKKQEENRNRRKKELRAQNRAWAKRNAQRPFSYIPFIFEPQLVLRQPYDWLMYRMFEKPLKTRLDELSTIEQQTAFSSFRITFLMAYLKESRIRYQCKRLLNAWLRHKMNKKASDAMDPITLNPIQHEIRVYDVKQRRCYLFEADSLNKAMKKNLYAHQYTIPVPRKPVNILTNKPFTYAQLISVHDQLLSSRCRIEDVALFRKWQFKLDTWKLYMYNHIYLAAIREELYNYQSADGKDMLEDFIKDMMFLVKIPLTELFEIVITNAVSWYPEHPLLQQFRALCLKSYESNTYQLNISVLVANRFLSLFQPNYPKCSLWDQVLDRMKADSDAEKALEEEDILMNG